MKRVLNILLLILSTIAIGQSTYREWIEDGKSYYELLVGQDGVYKVTGQELENSGVPVSSIDPRTVSLFYKGQEMAIKFTGEDDGVFDPEDYFLFYGEMNKGDDEVDLYKTPEHQVHPYYSLYSDTSSYFISWDNVSVKRMVNTTASGGAEPSVFKEKQLLLTQHYSTGVESPDYVYLSEADYAEGWMSGALLAGWSSTETISDITIRDVTDSIELELALVGRNIHDHQATLTVGSSSFILDGFSGITHKKFTVNIPGSEVVNDELTISITANGVDGNQDFLLLTYYNLKFKSREESQLHNALNFVSDQDSMSFEVENAVAPNYALNIFDTHNQSFVDVSTIAGLTTGAVLGGDAEIVMVVEDSLKSVGGVREATFQTFSNTANYLIVTHRNLSLSAEEYRIYRESVSGGGYEVEVAYFEDLKRSYSYGAKNPLAIKRYIRDHFESGNPEQVFIIGRSNQTNLYEGSINDYYRKVPLATNSSGERYFPDELVPSMGYPYSDALYTTGLDTNNPFTLAVPIGRLPISSDDDVMSYLDKVKEYETFAFDDLWMKRSLYLSGGKTSSEQSTYKGFVDSYANIWSNSILGGFYSSFHKNSSENIVSFNISEQINEGVSLVAYFGHSAPEFIEIEIGDINDTQNGYSNKGKYPILILNGCNASTIGGNMDSENRGLSWVVAKDKGAIAALGHTFYGYSNTLHDYSLKFHQNLVSDSSFFEKSIGEVMQETIRELMFNKTSNNLIEWSQVTQFLLIGDPGVRHFQATMPEYELVPESLKIYNKDSESLSTTQDSIEISVVLNNYGRVSDSTIVLCIRRSHPEKDSTYQFVIPGTKYSDTLEFTISNTGYEEFGGESTFELKIDCEDEITEYYEDNNVISSIKYFNDNTIRLITPIQYGIYPIDSVRFVAQNLDMGIEDVSYVLEYGVDPNFQTVEVDTLITGYLSDFGFKSLPLPKDTSVFFWRVKMIDGESDFDTSWHSSSFMIVSNETGWGQGDIYQLIENELSTLELDGSQTSLAFTRSTTNLDLSISGGDVADYLAQTRLNVDGQTYVSNPSGFVPDYCTTSGMIAMALDKNSGQPYHWNGVASPGTCGLGFVTGSYTVGSSNSLESYLKQYTDGDVVTIMTIGNANVPGWSLALKEQLDTMGAQYYDSVIVGAPYVIVLKVGGGVLYEAYGDSASVTLEVDLDVFFEATEGSLTTPEINHGGRLERVVLQSIIGIEDSLLFQTYDVLFDQPQDTLLVSEMSNIDTLLNNSENIKMNLWSLDTLNKTPSSISFWAAIYPHIPELVYEDRNGLIQAYNHQIRNAGEDMVLSFNVVNVTPGPSDSSYYAAVELFNSNGISVHQSYVPMGSLNGGDTLTVSDTVSTVFLGGEYSVMITINPTRELELYADNNLLEFLIEVTPDVVPPVLEVTYDGLYIQNGDFVSSSPEISMRLLEYNSFLKKQDTTDWTMELAEDCEFTCDYSALSFRNVDVSYSPATSTEDYEVIYTPVLDPGTYRLRVNAADASGNYAGEYEQEFIVSDESGLSYFYPYPNPFSGSCRFVYRFLGEDVPEEFSLVITTVAGHKVREILSSEMGGIRIGTNLSQYYWDGTDEAGKKLANGIYLYKLILQDNTSLLETEADGVIKGGIGKIYIAR